MSYDMELAILKKKSLETAQKIWKEYTLSELYSDFLFTRLHPEEYIIPEDEKGRWIYSCQMRIFDEFFEKEIGRNIECDEVFVIDETLYKKMCVWLKTKLKTTTFFDVKDDINKEYKLSNLTEAYNCMVKEKIDFEKEFVVFQHDW